MFSSIQATTWRVNNNDDTADFNEIQIAHNNVLAGDTLYIEGSSIVYESLTCTKQLTIIGPGYFLGENLLTAYAFPARVKSMIFELGSEGSKVIGIAFDYLNSSSADVFTDNISIERCYMKGYVDIKNVTGVRITNNYLAGINDYLTSTIFDQIFFNNNIVTGDININENCNIISCKNNIFLENSFTFKSSEFRNNIMVNENPSINIISSFIEYNIGTNNVFSGNNNINVSSINDLFVQGDSPDAQYQLSTNSQAIGAGYLGVDCGIFGGDEPYIISGLPPIPIITELEVDDAASIQTGLNVKIKVKSN